MSKVTSGFFFYARGQACAKVSSQKDTKNSKNSKNIQQQVFASGHPPNY
jgi:hypothetical protein